MAVNYPVSLDELINPSSTSSVANPSHAEQHSNANDAIEALQYKVGIDGSDVVTSHDYKISQLESLVTSAVSGAKSIYQDVRNNTGSSIAKGTPVYVSGTEGSSGKLFISPSSYSSEAASSKTLGITTSTISSNNNGQIISEGVLTNVDTTGANDGDPVWLGSNGTKIYGLLNKPHAPNHLVFLGVVIRGGHATTGSIFVKIQNGFELEELHNVSLVSPTNNQVLRYNISTGLWENQTIDNLFDPAGSASSALESANTYTDIAVADLGNSLPETYIPLSYYGNADGVATLDESGFVPQEQLNIDERIQDRAGALIEHNLHQNIQVTYDDVNNKIIFTALAQLTQEQVQDLLAPLFAHNSNPNITATYDDTNNKMILEAIIPPSSAIMSAQAPSNPVDGELWFDTDEYRTGTVRALKVWNALTSTWEYISSDLSLSTTNTWTSKNSFNQGVIIGLSAAPSSPIHGQIYYNTILNKLKVWDGLLWQDIQGSGGGGGLSLVPTDTSVPASTFFVGLIPPPEGAITEGDLWIDVDDDAGSTEFIFAGPNPPAEGTYGTDTLWIDTDDPDLPLIYSDNEPPSYSAVEGDFWVDLDDTSGQSILSSTTAPSPAQTEFWLDLTTEEGYLTYADLFKNNAAQVVNKQSLPTASNYGGMIAYVTSENALYVAAGGIWIKIFPTYDAEALIWSGI